MSNSEQINSLYEGVNHKMGITIGDEPHARESILFPAATLRR